MRFLLSDPKEDNGESDNEQTVQFEGLSYCCNDGKLFWFGIQAIRRLWIRLQYSRFYSYSVNHGSRCKV